VWRFARVARIFAVRARSCSDVSGDRLCGATKPNFSRVALSGPNSARGLWSDDRKTTTSRLRRLRVEELP